MLLERDEQLATLTQTLEGAAASGGKVVLIRGPAGIGKSALVTEFLSSVEKEAHTHIGYCDDLSTPQPLGPFWDIADDSPTIAGALEKGDRMEVMRAVLDLLSRRLRPNALVIEDTQWAGAATLDVIKYVGRRISRTNGLMVLTYRDAEVDRHHPLRLVIGDISPIDLLRISLDPLSLGAISELAIGSDLDPNAIAELTGGNPLFVNEVLRSGVEGVPSSVRDSVLGRMSKLSDETREPLDLISVVPGETEMELVDDLLPAAHEAIDEAVLAGLVSRDAIAAWFKHEVMRRAVESELSSQSRLRWNRLALRWLIEHDKDPIRIVHHAREVGDGAAIRTHAPDAARSAMAVGSYEEALELFRSLEPHLGESEDDRHAQLLEEWAEAELYADSGRAPALIDRAVSGRRILGAGIDLAKSLLLAAEIYQRLDRAEEASRFMSEALSLMEEHGGDSDYGLALGRMSWMSMRQGKWDLALDMCDQAIRLSDRLGTGSIAREAKNVKGTILIARGDQAGMRILEDLRLEAELAGDPIVQIKALTNMAYSAYGYDAKRGADLARRAIETARRFEHPMGVHIASQVYAEILLHTGDWDSAQQVATEALATSKSEHPVQADTVLVYLGVRTGSPDALHELERGWDEAERNGQLRFQVLLAGALAEHLWAHGLDRPTDLERLWSVREWTRTLWDRRPFPPLDFRLWMLGHPSLQDGDLQEPYDWMADSRAGEAADHWRRVGFPFEVALSLLYGSDSELVEALRIFEKLGARPFANRTRGMLKARGIPVPRKLDHHALDHPVGLTARQDEVLQLIGEGLTDNEIADRLFLSPRTVHHHVSAVLGKLGASNRTEAVSIAISSGLIRQTI